MTPEHATLTLCLFAAFVDGAKDDREREQIRRVAESFGQEDPQLPRLYQDVLLGRVTPAEAASALKTPGQRQLAYEMAVTVCNADGRLCAAESRFLGELKTLLGLDANAEVAQGEGVAAAIAEVSPLVAQPAAVQSPAIDEAELDRRILNAAIVNGALELLPQSWASVAIIPLQIRLVYTVGKAHGYELDQGHIKEFLATVGVGLTSQYIEQFGRKLIGGLLGAVAGRAVAGLGRATTGMAFSFASTYALGHIAKRYYGGGRTMSAAALQAEFQRLLEPARGLQRQYLPQIQQRAAGLDASQVMSMVRGSTV
jgi:uncharacterized protein (DUF697 family)/uncharacterized tellurite resistance protein B-like protein